MILTRRYAIAFAIVLLPIVAWLGSDVVRQDTTAGCSRCGSSGHLSQRYWCVWGVRRQGNRKEDVQPSLFLQDFPEFRCEHDWDHQTYKNARVWGGPLFQAAPRGSGGGMIACGAGASFATQLYIHEAAFRDKLKEALEDELVTRGQVVRWFEFRWIALAEPFDLREGEAEAFNQLNAIVDKISGDGPVFAPLPVQVPRVAPPKPF